MNISKNSLANFVKRNSILRVSFYFFDVFHRQLNHNIFSLIKNLKWFFQDYFKFKSSHKNLGAPISFSDVIPQLADKTSFNPMDYIYILQNAWACNKIFSFKPKSHVDVGSSVSAVAIMSQFVPTTFVDIREIDFNLKNLKFMKGSILNLPFEDGSVESISSICVIEHIGLGRYGDRINPFGTEKSISEMLRVVNKGGQIILSVPVWKDNRVRFNAHREFSPDYFVKLFKDAKLLEQKFIVGSKIKNSFSEDDDNVVGLFLFKKL